MSYNPYSTEERARSEAQATLFGPARPGDYVAPPWDWRRELARALLFGVEGAWLLAWALFWIQRTSPQPFEAGGRLVGGWLGLALLALAAGHLAMRWEGRAGWLRVRSALALLIALTTVAWWGWVSGGLRPFLSQVGGLFQLRPGAGFWTLWLGILVWARGLDWSQSEMGLARTRRTLQGSLGLLALLALLGRGSLIGAATLLWLAGLVALGLTRIVTEDWRLAVSRSLAVALAQGALVLGAALGTLLAALGLHWFLRAEQRMALRDGFWYYAQGPIWELALLMLRVALFVITLVWEIVYWSVTHVADWLGVSFTALPAPPLQGEGGSADGLLLWLSQLLSPEMWFALRLMLFVLFGLVALFILVTRLDRMRYSAGQRVVQEDAPRLTRRWGALDMVRAALPRPSLWGARHEPQDAVRRAYVRLVRLGALRGAGWQPRRTPYEHEVLLQRALPGHEADIHLITEQYVRVRYAGEALGEAEVGAVQAAWERVAGRHATA